MKMLKKILRQKLILRTVAGVCAGITIGLVLKISTPQPWSKRNIMYLKFPGEVFMRMVNCLILPLVMSSIVSATCNLKKSGKIFNIIFIIINQYHLILINFFKYIGRIGTMALYYYTTTTLLGITLSVVLVQTIKPGELLKNKNIISQNSTKSFMTVDTILDLFRYFIYSTHTFIVLLSFISCSSLLFLFYRNLVPENIMSACLSQVMKIFFLNLC